jgi:hypothetical protein
MECLLEADRDLKLAYLSMLLKWPAEDTKLQEQTSKASASGFTV